MGRKKKEMDQLSIDASNAIKAGMSYGQYMAMKPKKIEPEIKKKVVAGYIKTCPICGKEFSTHLRVKKYCSDECKERSYYKIKIPENKPCEVCGNEFAVRSSRSRYCCRRCADKAQRQRSKEYQARKREAAKNG